LDPSFGPELDKRWRLHLNPANKFYRVNETYINVKGKTSDAVNMIRKGRIRWVAKEDPAGEAVRG
jgi:transposase-like protein